MSAAPKYRTAARRVRGLGAARTGTGHFIGQRVTSVALVLLTIAFFAIVIGTIGRNHAAVVQILASPLVGYGWDGMVPAVYPYVDPAFEPAMHSFRHLHNGFISFSASAGILGSLSFVALSVMPVVAAEWQYILGLE